MDLQKIEAPTEKEQIVGQLDSFKAGLLRDIDRAFGKLDYTDTKILICFYYPRRANTLSGLRALSFRVLVTELRKRGVLLGLEGIRTRVKKIVSYGLLRVKRDPFGKSRFRNIRFYYPLPDKMLVERIRENIREKNRQMGLNEL